MGPFGYSKFTAPYEMDDVSLPNIQDVDRRRRSRKREDTDLEKEMMDFQSNLRLQELGKTIALQKSAAQDERAMQPLKYNPPMFLNQYGAMTPYQSGQLELGRDRLAASREANQDRTELGERRIDTTRSLGEERNKTTKELGEGRIAATTANNTTRNAIGQQNADTRARLAALHNLSDSEKIALLQSGKVELQDLKDAAAMDRLERQGTITSGQIDQRGDIESEHITQRGNVYKDEAAVRGEEARKTKAAPSGNANATSQLPTQQIKAYQLRANQGMLDNPNWKKWMTINPNTGMVDLTPHSEHWWGSTGPSQDDYDQMVKYLKNEPQTPSGVSSNVQPRSPIDDAISYSYPYAHPINFGPSSNAAPTTGSPKTELPKTGTVRVKSSDGRTGTWDYSKGPLPKGFTILDEENRK